MLNANERQFDPAPAPDDEWLGPGYEGAEHCWIQADWSLKYDVWRVDPTCLEPCYEDDQRDIDEIEERHLLHQGTATELEPWIRQNGQPITLQEYNVADTLEVPVSVLGGGSIQDNDVIEITWYSEKSIEQNSDGPGWGCHLDTLFVGDITYVMWSTGCSYDYESQEMHIYDQGVTDWANNSGAKYVEQRFIVDMSGPVCNIVGPAATVDPTVTMLIDVTYTDGGSGVNPSTVSLTVVDPEGNTVVPTITSSTAGRITAEVPGPLKRGDYQIKFTSQDYLGNACNSVKTVRVEASVLALAGAKMTPNPFNPGDLSMGNAKFHLGLTKSSYVTVTVYDFAGLEVATLLNHDWKVPGDVIEWGAQAADGTALANGAYIVRITADDGAKIAEQSLKVVIWRE
jgi:5-hydroxyisourate hydrolase-like protein (transthyretin family)